MAGQRRVDQPRKEAGVEHFDMEAVVERPRRVVVEHERERTGARNQTAGSQPLDDAQHIDRADHHGDHRHRQQPERGRVEGVERGQRQHDPMGVHGEITLLRPQHVVRALDEHRSAVQRLKGRPIVVHREVHGVDLARLESRKNEPESVSATTDAAVQTRRDDGVQSSRAAMSARPSATDGREPLPPCHRRGAELTRGSRSANRRVATPQTPRAQQARARSTRAERRGDA